MMDALLELEAELVAWLNRGVGKFFLLDRATYLVVSDYFVPLLMAFWMLGLWFHGKDAGARNRNQRAVLSAAISLGFANLAVLALNQHYFRERPIAEMELANLLYAATDSSFPSNPAAVAFAVAMSIWLGNRRASALLFFLAALWSFARLYNGLFYPSDVAAGALIGVSVSCIVALALRAIEPLPTWVLKGARLLHLA